MGSSGDVRLLLLHYHDYASYTFLLNPSVSLDFSSRSPTSTYFILQLAEEGGAFTPSTEQMLQEN